MQLHDTFVWMGAVVTSARSAAGAISAHISYGGNFCPHSLRKWSCKDCSIAAAELATGL
jgi:hypothetical protein